MATGKRRRQLSAMGLGLTLAMVTSGCLSSGDDGGGGGSGGAGNDLGSDDGDKTVTILGAFQGAEEEAFLETLAPFEEESGITIEYTGDQDFTTTIRTRADAGDAPDIAFFPQPGGLLDMADDGLVAPLNDVIDLPAIEETLIPGFLDAATQDGDVYGAPMRMAVKSLVWYPKKAYEDAGYNTEPATMQELQEVADQIQSDGTAPNFATSFYPEDVQANLDEEVGVYALPPIEGGFDGQPILGGGDLAATFNGDDEDTQEVLEWLTSDQFGAEWAQAGGWLSPHATFDASNYPDETTRTIAESAAGSDVFRFDASDLMPAVIGSGTFWTEMVKWVDGQSSEDTLAAIEADWPSS
jgi:ABC-type glycerol-3-phosphate transport system substrate-binding protein